MGAESEHLTDHGNAAPNLRQTDTYPFPRSVPAIKYVLFFLYMFFITL
jgi:hypothetical protein